MKLPTISSAPPTVILMPVKSIPPIMIPKRGVITSPTSELTIAVKAPPIMMPTAMLITSPFDINSLNSDINFFIYFSSIFKISFSIRSQGKPMTLS